MDINSFSPGRWIEVREIGYPKITNIFFTLDSNSVVFGNKVFNIDSETLFKTQKYIGSHDRTGEEEITLYSSMSPDGKYLVGVDSSSEGEKFIEIIELKTGRVLKRIGRNHKRNRYIEIPKISQNNKLVATRNVDNILVFDIERDKIVAELSSERAKWVEFSEDNSHLYVVSESAFNYNYSNLSPLLLKWDIHNNRVYDFTGNLYPSTIKNEDRDKVIDTFEFRSVYFTQRHEIACIAGVRKQIKINKCIGNKEEIIYYFIDVIDLRNGKKINTVFKDELKRSYISAVNISSSGNLIIFCLSNAFKGSDNTVKILEVETGKCIKEIKYEDRVSSAAISQDEKRIAFLGRNFGIGNIIEL